MPVYDERNVLHVGPPQRRGNPKVTPTMAQSVCQHIKVAGDRSADFSGCGGYRTLWIPMKGFRMLHDFVPSQA